MSDNYTVFLTKDMFCENDFDIRCSGQSGALIRPPHRREFFGSSIPRSMGTFNGPRTTELRIKFHNVGNMEAGTDLGVTTIPTKPKGGMQNAGDGSCVAWSHSTNLTICIDVVMTYDSANVEWDIVIYYTVGGPGHEDVSVPYVSGNTEEVSLVGAPGVPLFKYCITDGDSEFANGDTFTFSCRQAQFKYSLDGVIWTSTYNGDSMYLRDDATWQDNVVNILPNDAVGNWKADVIWGAYGRLYFQWDTEPIIKDDVIYITCRYAYGYEALAVQELLRKFRSKSADRLAFFIDTGSTYDIDMISWLYHNLQDGDANTWLKIIGVSDNQILKLRGTITGVVKDNGTSTVSITPGMALTNNEFVDLGDPTKIAYFHICSGLAQQKSYAITGNAAGTVTVTGDLVADGVTEDDEWIIEPQPTWGHVDFEEGTGSMGGQLPNITEGENYGEDFTQETMRGFIIVINDPTNPDGYFEFPFLRIGPADLVDPAAPEGPYCHQLINGATLKSFQDNTRSIINTHVKYPKGIHQAVIPLLWDPVTPTGRDDLLEIWKYCGGLTRARAVIFFPDINDWSNQIIGWFTDMGYSNPVSEQELWAIVSTSLETLEVE